MGSYQNRSSIFYIINKWVNSTLTCLTHNNDVGYNLLCWLNQRFNQRKKMIVSGCYSIGGAEVTYICHSMRLLIVRRNYSIPKQHKLANNFLNQKTLVAHTKWQDPMNNFEWIIFLKGWLDTYTKWHMLHTWLPHNLLPIPILLHQAVDLKWPDSLFVSRQVPFWHKPVWPIKINFIFIQYKFKF